MAGAIRNAFREETTEYRDNEGRESSALTIRRMVLGTFAIGAPILASREREAGPTAGISHQLLESGRQMTQ